jgi:hypothetical protein
MPHHPSSILHPNKNLTFGEKKGEVINNFPNVCMALLIVVYIIHIISSKICHLMFLNAKFIETLSLFISSSHHLWRRVVNTCQPKNSYLVLVFCLRENSLTLKKAYLALSILNLPIWTESCPPVGFGTQQREVRGEMTILPWTKKMNHCRV